MSSWAGLMRLRSNRKLSRLYGAKFKLNETTTWWSADEDIEVSHPSLGRLQIRCWQQLHFRKAAQHPMNLIQVQRGRARSTRPLWLAWVGQTMPPLEQLWAYYLNRFALEHWYRFIKQVALDLASTGLTPSR